MFTDYGRVRSNYFRQPFISVLLQTSGGTKMEDPFDSSALFAEFNKPRQASDRILMSNLSGKSPNKITVGLENGAQSVTNQGVKESQSSSGSDSSGDDSSDSDNEENCSDKAQHKRWDSDGDGPVEIGVDESGCVLYRPGEKERRIGLKLLQNADYGDESHSLRVGDKEIENISEVQKLRAMNNLYKKQTRLIDPTRHIPVNELHDGPALQVLFMNHRFARKYRGEIERFVTDLIMHDYDDGSTKPVRTRSHHVCVAEGSNEVRDQAYSEIEQRTSTVIGCSRFYTDFTLDHMGFPLIDYIPSLSDGWEIPRYAQQFRKVMPDDDDSDDDDKPPKPAKMQRGCFNCGGQHSLNECQEQRDSQRIAASRRRFQDQAASRQPQGTLNKGIGQQSKFSAFKPGVYSDALLKGLGLRHGQIPFFAYKMRVLGYPPGYLQEAEVDQSGITMFDKDGQSPMHAGQEDGEMEKPENEQVVYDVDKIIDFPGFNVALPEGTEDEAHLYGFPPMNSFQSKEHMQKSLPTPKGLKRAHSRRNDGPQGPKKARLVDMDLDNSGRGAALDFGRSSSSGSLGGRSNTPTIEDLVAQQQLLQEQLQQDDSSQGSSTGMPDSQLDRLTMPAPGLMTTPSRGINQKESPLAMPPVTPLSVGAPNATSTPGQDPFKTPVASPNISLNRSNSESLCKTMSTPVTKVCKEDLPDALRFRQGVQEHIPFENLPDAVGTYDKMKGLITQIRELKKQKSQ